VEKFPSILAKITPQAAYDGGQVVIWVSPALSSIRQQQFSIKNKIIRNIYKLKKNYITNKNSNNNNNY